MADKMFENNQVSIIGEIVSDFQFSHEVYGEGFYMMEVSVRRLSDCMDYIPVMVSERLINVEGDYIGKSVYIGGQFRSFNRHEEKKNRLVLSVFARELEVLDSDYDEDAANQIFLDGYICKEAIYRKMCCLQSTALTESQITFHVSVGEEMPDLRRPLRWVHMCRYGAESRAETM